MPQQQPDPIESGNQDERPEWLPANFDSPEALAKSYGEAQRKITEQGQTLSAMEQNLADLSEQFETLQQQPPAQQFDRGNNPFVAGFRGAMEEGDYDTALELQAQLTQAAVRQELAQFAQQFQGQQQPQLEAQLNQSAFLADQQLAAQYPDWAEVKERIAQTIQQAPYLVPEEVLTSPQKTAEALDRVYKIVKADDLASQETQQAAGQRQRELAQLAPQNAGRIIPEDQAKAEWQRIRDAVPDNPWTRG